jgi:tetratricopeptide (TPR) repeat protein
VSLEWGDLLNGLAIGSHRSLVILTSREFPADLADRRLPNAKPNRALVRVETVEQVDEMSAIEILQEYGMQDSPEDLAWIARQVDGHPIYLQLLAANYGDRPGFLRKNPQELAGGLDGELTKQLARQSEAARELARRMCVLRVAIDVQGLTFLRLYEEGELRFDLDIRAAIFDPDIRAAIAEDEELREIFTDTNFDFTSEEIAETAAILDCLARGSLVQRQYDPKKCVDEFSMHRVIVEFLERELGEARSGLLGSVYQFYLSGCTVENPQTLDDLQPLLEAQYFAFQLGNYSEAANLIYELEEYLDPWGYWALKKELCEQVLPHLPRASQPYILQRMGIIFRDWGDWNQAEIYYHQALDLAQAENDHDGLMASLQGQLGEIERNRGNWDEAERLYRQSLKMSMELGNRSGMASSWASLGDIERNRGNWDEAERLFRQSLELRTELGDRSGMAAIWGAFGDIAWERENWDEAEDLYRKCLALKTELGELRGVAFSHEDLAKVETRKGNPDRAQHHYTIARDLYTQLGATKDLDRIQSEFNPQ